MSASRTKTSMKYSSRINVEAHLPMLPNFIKFGSKYEISMPVSELPKKVLRQIGRAWTEALVAKSEVK